MKILFSTDQIYLHGGLEKVMAEKANYFVEEFDYEVFILTTEQKGKQPCYFLNEKIKIIDLKVNYQREKSFFHFNNLKKIPFHFKQWNKALNDIKPDIIIVCNQAFDFYWTPFFNTNIKKIREFHATAFNLSLAKKNAGLLKKIQFSINDFVESKYNKIILLNEDEKSFYKSKNTVVIPNPLTLSDRQASLKNKKVIAAGRIAYVKGFEFLIESWKYVFDKCPNWELHIYGQGEKQYIDNLQKLTIEKGLEKNVFIMDAVPNLLDVMFDYSMFIMSSRNECFPMVLLESLSIGLPIVSFDCPTGPRNIITQNEDGFLVDNGNCEHLSDKIVHLIQNEKRRLEMGINAKKNSYRFEKTVIMKKWQLVFKQLIS